LPGTRVARRKKGVESGERFSALLVANRDDCRERVSDCAYRNRQNLSSDSGSASSFLLYRSTQFR
jgi:hypothetical protein